jgi:hypothetical protein
MANKFTIAKNTKRSPLKALPLHTAGQSIDEEIHRIQTVEISSYLVAAACMLFLSCFEWYKWLTSAPPSPVLISIGAAVVVSYCVYKIIKFRQEVKTLRLARDGERAVGEYLDSFRQQGYRVLHDLVVGDFNIDHVIIGKTGVYTIETKTISKYVRGDQRIYYNGEEISINGIKPDRNPIIQAKAQASWVKDFIQDSIKKNIDIQPVVVFPGWFVDGNQKEVWVLEPKALKAFISRKDEILDETDVSIIANYLSRYLRTREEYSRKN